MPPIGGIPTRAPAPAPRSAAASSDATHFAPTSAPVHNAPRPSAAASSDATHFAPTSAPVHNAPHSPTWHLAAVAPSASPDARHQAAQALINVANAAHAVTHSIVPQLNPASETVAGAREALARAGTIHGLDVPHVSSIAHSSGIPTATLALGAKAAGAVTPDVAAAVHDLKMPTGILGRFVQGAGNWPSGLVKGAVQFGSAAATDAVHGRLADLNPIDLALGAAGVEHGTAVQRQLHGAVKSDPIYQSIKQGSFNPMLKDPWGTFLDATGLYGVAGDAAGAVARTGALGDTVKGAASLARDSRTAMPGADFAGTTVERGGSPNIFTRAVQHAVDKSEAQIPGKVGDQIRTFNSGRIIRRQVASQRTAEAAVRKAELDEATKALKKVRPKDETTANVAPIMVGHGITTAELPQVRDMIAEPLHPDTELGAVQARDRILGHLNDAIEKAQSSPEAAAKMDADVNKVREVYEGLQAKRERTAQELGIRSEEEMAQAMTKRVAATHPDVTHLDTPVVHPELKQALQEAKSAKVEAEADLARAQKEAAMSKGAHAGASSTLAQVQRSLPVSPATDLLQDKVIDLRDMLEQSKAAAPQFHSDRVNFLKDVVNEKRADLEDIRKQISSPAGKMKGMVIKDPEAPPILSGKYRGQRLRPITEEDAQRIGTAPASFVSARNPLRHADQGVGDLLGSKRAGLAETGSQPYTGLSLRHGDFQPGYNGLLGSQYRDITRASAIRGQNAFMDRFSDVGHATKRAAQDAAASYQDRFGVPLHPEPVERNGQWYNIPAEAKKEWDRQDKLDHPSKAVQMLMTPNTLLRKTALPYSKKLLVMHNMENITRVSLAEGSPLHALVRAPLDYMRWRRVLKEADLRDPTGALKEHLKTLVTPGGLSHAGEGQVGEAFTGELPAEHGRAATALRGVLHGLDTTGTTIIKVQRAGERASQYVAAGAHARRMFQEMGHSWLAANTSVKKLAQDVIDGVATPAGAERAASAVHDTMGKYNAFTSTGRLGLRVAPFGAWAANALKLIYMVLPRDHPLLSALLHDTETANAPAWNAQHKGLPGDMQADLAMGHGAYQDLGQFLPTGGGTSPIEQAVGITAPAVQSFFDPLIGKGAFGQDLQTPMDKFGVPYIPHGVFGKHRGKAILAAVEGALESSTGPTPLIARGMYSHGGTLYNTDTPVIHLLTGQGPIAVKKGTAGEANGPLRGILGSGLDKVIDPFVPTVYNSKGAKTKSSKAGLFGGGGSGKPKSGLFGGGAKKSTSGGLFGNG